MGTLQLQPSMAALVLMRAGRVAQASRPTMCRAFAVKTTTGIVGYPVDPHAHETLKGLYSQTFEALSDIPADAEYRKCVEAITNHRLKVITEQADWIEVEEMIGFQMEEMIQDAKDELELIPQMAEWKPWVGSSGEIKNDE